MGRRVHWNGLSPSKGRDNHKFPLKNYCLTYKDVYNFAFVHLNLHTSCSSLSVVLCPLPIAISQFTIAHIAHCAQTLIGVQLRLKIGPAFNFFPTQVLRTGACYCCWLSKLQTVASMPTYLQGIKLFLLDALASLDFKLSLTESVTFIYS